MIRDPQDAAFTPGPWTIDEDHWIIDIKIGAQSDTVRFAYARIFVPTWDWQRPDAEDHANARLIAAAPDLYSALFNLGDAVLRFMDDDSDIPDELLDAATAALRKAEGRDS